MRGNGRMDAESDQVGEERIGSSAREEEEGRQVWGYEGRGIAGWEGTKGGARGEGTPRGEVASEATGEGGDREVGRWHW